MALKLISISDFESINDKTDVEFIEYIKDFPSSDELTKDLNKLMIFEDGTAKESVIYEYFCGGGHNNCDIVFLNQNLFSFENKM